MVVLVSALSMDGVAKYYILPAVTCIRPMILNQLLPLIRRTHAVLQTAMHDTTVNTVAATTATNDTTCNTLSLVTALFTDNTIIVDYTHYSAMENTVM